MARKKKVDMDYMCKSIALWNFRLVPRFDKVLPSTLICTSSKLKSDDDITVLCIESPIIDGVYAKAVFNLSSNGILNYFIAYVSKTN